MRLSVSERKEFILILRELLTVEQIHEMKQYIQHGSTSTFTHCLIVAYHSYLLARRLPIGFDTRSIVRGAMLHDFYLYDWHIPDKSHRLHGFYHPGFALKNARKHYQLNRIEEDIIEKHMWPLTLHKVPCYRESMLVSLVDKLCSAAEIFRLPMLPKQYRHLQQLIVKKAL